MGSYVLVNPEKSGNTPCGCVPPANCNEGWKSINTSVLKRIDIDNVRLCDEQHATVCPGLRRITNLNMKKKSLLGSVVEFLDISPVKIP
jgi:hypothetical protein